MGRLRAWKLVAFAPVLVVLYANWLFVRNHFYARGAYFHDSGWFSYTVFRAGIMPRNPETSGDLVYYWGWHVSGIVSLGSILSYLFPGDRVDWYAIFQALIYAPLALAVPILVPGEARSGARSALLVGACSLAFAFGGQVLSCIGYPHFEVFSGAGIALMLAGLATGRERLAWVGLAMSIATREDGGFHAASFLVAVLAADLFRRPFPIPRRRVIVMTAVALGATVVMIVLQKKLFVSVNAFEQYITGKPAYAHLTGAEIAARLTTFRTKGGFIWLPMLATGAIAFLRRDARYLLGWVVTLPWFVLNFTAHQDIKAALAVYTGFPFIGSAFWVAAYARSEASRTRAPGWRWPLVAVAVVSLASTLGMFLCFPVPARTMIDSCFVPAARNPAGLRAFARGLRARAYGAVRMDPAMASWAVEGVRTEDLFFDADADEGLRAGDGYAFFFEPRSIDALARSPFPSCGRVADTRAFFCTRRGTPLPGTVRPSSPLLQLVHLDADHVRRDGETVVVDAAEPGIRTFGPYVRLRAGSYVVAWDIAWDRCDPAAPQPNAHVDVLRGGNTISKMLDVAASDAKVELAFEVAPGDHDLEYEFRTFSGTCGFVLRGMDLRLER